MNFFLCFVHQDLAQCVDEDFPIGTELTKLQQQAEAHNAFAAARCRVYIGREEYFTSINEQREKKHHEPFVLLGESGMNTVMSMQANVLPLHSLDS